MTIQWRRSTGDFVESHCGRWRITPIYGGLTRPESYEVCLDDQVVGSSATQRECKEIAEGRLRTRSRVLARGHRGGTRSPPPSRVKPVPARLSRCPSCGAALLSEPRGAPLRCTRCDWRLISRDEWLALKPRAQGYVFYLQSSWPTSELAGEKNPHAEGTPAWRVFRDGEERAVLSAQDSEE